MSLLSQQAASSWQLRTFRHGSCGAAHSALGLVCLVLLAAGGCGGKSGPERVAVYPVDGTVTFKGQPMPGAFIVFHPKTPQPNAPSPRAEINKDGVLKVSTYDGGDGAPEGEYVVTIEWRKLVKNGADVVAGPNVVPRKYSRPETSDIVRKVAAAPTTLEPIQL